MKKYHNIKSGYNMNFGLYFDFISISVIQKNDKLLVTCVTILAKITDICFKFIHPKWL